MNYKTTLVLLFLVLCAGAYFILFRPDGANTGGTGTSILDDREGVALFKADDLSTESIAAVTVERRGKRFVMEKSGTDWVQTSPVRFPINDWSARQIVQSLAGLRASQTLKPDDKSRPALDKLGLAPPAGSVTVTTSDKKTFSVRVGHAAPGGRAFVMVGEDPNVYVVPDAIQKVVTTDDVNTWRRTKLTTPTEGQLTRVTLTRGGGKIEMDKRDGRWVFGGDNQGRVDRAAVQGLVSAVDELSIAKFVEDVPANLSIYGLDKPAVVLTLESPDVAPAGTQPTTQPKEGAAKPVVRTLTIGAPSDLAKTAYFATWNPGQAVEAKGEGDITGRIVFTITKASAGRFEKSADDLRDPHITTVAAGDVKKVTIKPGAGAAIALVKTPDGWEFAPGSGVAFKADHDAVSKLIEGIVDAKAHAFQPADKLGAARGSLTLEAQGKSEPEVIALYEAPPDKGQPRILAVRGREPIAYRLDAGLLPVTHVTPLLLRSKAVLDIAPDSIRRVTLARAGEAALVFEAQTPATQPATKPAGHATKWSLKGHEKFETGAFRSLLAHLASLEATRWLDAAPDLGKSPTLVTLETAGGKPLVLHVNPGTGAATLEGEAHAFEVPKPIRDALAAEYLDRTAIPTASGDIERIKVSNPDAKLKEVTLERDVGGKFVSVEDQPIDQSAAGAMFDAVGNLRVERYLPAGDAGAAKIHLTIEPKNGKPIELAISPGGTDGNRVTMTGGLGERTFRVPLDTLKKLTADPSEKPAASEDDMGGMQIPGMGD